MSSKRVLKILFISFVFISCKPDFMEKTDNSIEENNKSNGGALLELSYDIKTSKTFEMPPVELSDLDKANLNPSNEKQHVTLQLFENGQMNMTILKMDFGEKIVIPHQIPADPSQQIVRTEIMGNTISFYDKDSNLLDSQVFEMPDNMGMVDAIKEFGKNATTETVNQLISSMQGQELIESIIENAPENSIQITQQDENFVTLRVSYLQFDSRMNEEAVLLIDQRINRLVGSRLYDSNNGLLQSTYYGYDIDEGNTLSAIKTMSKLVLPSENIVTLITNAKIENMQYDLNL